MKRIAVCVSNSGLGHTKRIAHLLNELNARLTGHLGIDVLVDAQRFRVFSPLLDGRKKHLQIICHDVKGQGAIYASQIEMRYLSLLTKADHVWSDNEIFPLRHREDTFFTGSFLWCEVENHSRNNEKEKTLVARCNPTMIANQYCLTPGVKKWTSVIPVGMYAYDTVCHEADRPTGVLISCGSTTAGRACLEKAMPAVKSILRQKPESVPFYMEPLFHEECKAIPGARRADYSEKMFSDIKAAAIRPGFGTLSSVLAKGGRIFSFCEKENFEVNHNAVCLESIGVGEQAGGVGEALARALHYLDDETRQKEHYRCLQTIDFDGLGKTVDAILSIIDN